MPEKLSARVGGKVITQTREEQKLRSERAELRQMETFRKNFTIRVS